MYILGFDIGGTKCAAITADYDGESIIIKNKIKVPIDLSVSPYVMLERLVDASHKILETKPEAIGISCGGPLDSESGVILSPPNLPGWDNVRVKEYMENHYGVSARLQNDANACALAEWKFGAGKGTKNMIFLTFGTGLGAGLILDGRLYSGTNGNAGEVGHIRLDKRGPEGYGKKGSFEGFCSGGGLAQLGYAAATECSEKGFLPAYCKEPLRESDITAKSIAIAAKQGDETALSVYESCGRYLGRGLSVIIDILNPERIVLGSIFERSEELLRPYMEEEIKKEALSLSAQCCKIVPAALGEEIGDYAAIGAALV